MPELVSVGEKGQIVIPKQLREDLRIEKGTKLLIEEEGQTLILKKIDLTEDMLWMLVGEETLQKTWDNQYDKQWDDLL